MLWGYSKGQAIPLDTLVQRFGGNKQSGIIPSNREPAIILINQPKSRNVYKNRWREDGILEFYAQGRVGDQEWTPNNRAVRDHFVDGRSLLVFETVGKLKRFEGEYVLTGVQTRQELDEDTPPKLRRVYVFELEPLDVSLADTSIAPPPAGYDIDHLRKRAYQASLEVKDDPKPSTRKIFERSKDVHQYVLARANGACEARACDQPPSFINKRTNQPYLEAHHTHRRSDAGPDAPTHVIALCPACHRRVHFGVDGDTYNEALKVDVADLENARGAVN